MDGKRGSVNVHDDFGAFVPGEHHIELATGEYLDLAAPDPDRITVDAVAHGLSHVCRFAGQASRFYSVAEHAALVATKLRADGHPAEVQLAGLHHDDAEAFLGDVTRPLKALLPGYRDLEVQVGYAVRQALGLPDPDLETVAAVKAADDWAICPRCLSDAKAAALRKYQEVMALYGTIPVEDFDAKRAELKDPDPEDFRTFREDYEFFGAERGEVTADYEGVCSKCNLNVSLRESRRFWTEGENDG